MRHGEISRTGKKLTCSSASVYLSLKLTDPMLQIMMLMCVKAGDCCLYLSIRCMRTNEVLPLLEEGCGTCSNEKGGEACPSTIEDIPVYTGIGFRLIGRPQHFRGYVHERIVLKTLRSSQSPKGSIIIRQYMCAL